MHDYNTGLELESFRVVADFPLAGTAPGENLAGKFRQQSPGVWVCNLPATRADIASGKLTVEIRDRQGNTSRVERTFSAGTGRQP
jgi:hypothetical protein